MAKTEEEVALELMTQLKEPDHPKTPPVVATDGKGSYREAMVETWGQLSAYAGRSRPPMHQISLARFEETCSGSLSGGQV
jgi:hypothetical protein